MGKIEKFREILQQYADKGHERFNNALDKYEEGERSDEFYWDGYSDCAESLLKIYDSMQKELQVRKYKCLHDYYPFGEPRSYTAGKIYDVLRDDQGVEWITNDNGHSELFGYFSNHFELVVEPENKLEEIPPKLPLISTNNEPVNVELEKELKMFLNSDEYINTLNVSGYLLIARHFVNWQKELLMNKTLEFFYDQLNNGDMECGDIEKFIENFKNKIGE